ncbi:MAG TPA: type IV pilus biogenesis protein PilP, partial [Anaerolineae bacterium]|nr:type IV pilus biogenesis protein PilP [Anaerolineae bacterium]
KDDTDNVVTTETTGSPETTGTPNASKVATGTPETTGTAKATTETAAEETETVLTKYDLSGYKDPFKPLFSAAEINNGTTTDGSNVSNTSNTSSTNQSTSNPVTSNVDSHQLSLVRIVDQNGQRYATVSYQGQEYTVKEGDQIAGSPFKVTDIGDGSITLLYGDDRLTLQLGDEIIK